MTRDVRVVSVQLHKQLLTHGGSLTRLLPAAQAEVADKDRALLQALAYGMCRWSVQLQALVDALLAKPMKAKDQDVYLLMQLGVLQLTRMNMPEHAAVNTAVKAATGLGKPWARRLVNGVLRNYQRGADSMQQQLSPAAAIAHPDWLLHRIQQDWPSAWQQIVADNNCQAPMTLRVRASPERDCYAAKLAASQTAYGRFTTWLPQALTLEQATGVDQLPGFGDGHVSVQDAAAQLAAPLLAHVSPKGGRLLDACAAPGGKTAHALELDHYAEVVAIDEDQLRLERVRDTLQRIQIGGDRCTLMRADAAAVDSWWDGKVFDAVLLDAPCSGTGVIRRHPDIKLLRRDDDIDTLVAKQRRLLNALWQTVSVGGHLLYATCSVLKAENEQQARAFLAQQADAVSISIPIEPRHANELGMQILPGENGMDGFFYALFEKRA